MSIISTGLIDSCSVIGDFLVDITKDLVLDGSGGEMTLEEIEDAKLDQIEEEEIGKGNTFSHFTFCSVTNIFNKLK